MGIDQELAMVGVQIGDRRVHRSGVMHQSFVSTTPLGPGIPGT